MQACHTQVTRGEEQGLDSRRQESLFEVLQMDGVSGVVVVAPVAVLVLDLAKKVVFIAFLLISSMKTYLGHDDGSPAAAGRRVPLKVLHPRDHLGDEDVGALLVPGERRPEKHWMLVQKPAAEFGMYMTGLTLR